jgi:hypothetical protein
MPANKWADMHKKNWRINIQDSEFELEDFSQNANAGLLPKQRCRAHLLKVEKNMRPL